VKKARLSPALLALLPPERIAALPPVLRGREEMRALVWAVHHAHGRLDALDEEERRRGRQAYLAALAFNLPRLDALDRLLAAAREDGLALIALKGAALARSHYGDVGARPMVDVDVLCAPSERERALEVARRAGFEVHERATFRRARGAFHDTLLRDGPVLIELHHRLWHELELPSDATLLTARARVVETEGVPRTVPATADHLFFVMVHAATHGFAGNPLWMIDALLLAGGDEAVFDDAASAARDAGALLPFAAARDQLALVFPERVTAGGGPASLRRALLRRLLPWLLRGEAELGPWPSRLVRPLLLDGAAALARWTAEKAAMLRGALRERDR